MDMLSRRDGAGGVADGQTVLDDLIPFTEAHQRQLVAAGRVTQGEGNTFVRYLLAGGELSQVTSTLSAGWMRITACMDTP